MYFNVLYKKYSVTINVEFESTYILDCYCHMRKEYGFKNEQLQVYNKHLILHGV